MKKSNLSYLIFGPISGSDKGTTFGFKREQVLRAVNITLPEGVNNPNIYISSAQGYGKIPAVTCNVNLQ